MPGIVGLITKTRRDEAERQVKEYESTYEQV